MVRRRVGRTDKLTYSNKDKDLLTTHRLTDVETDRHTYRYPNRHAYRDMHGLTQQQTCVGNKNMERKSIIRIDTKIRTDGGADIQTNR